jgi:hypothetical protein
MPKKISIVDVGNEEVKDLPVETPVEPVETPVETLVEPVEQAVEQEVNTKSIKKRDLGQW